MSRRQAVSTRALLRRATFTDLGAGLVVALVIMVAAALLAAWPRAIETLGDDALRAAAQASTPVTRDLASVGVELVTGPSPTADTGLDPASEAVFGQVEAATTAVHDAMPAPMSDVTDRAGYRARARVLHPVGTAEGSDVRFAKLQFAADPHLGENVTLDEGRWPTAVPDLDPSMGWQMQDVVSADRSAAFGVVLATPSAQRLSWTVGEARPLTATGREVVLVGTYSAVDPDDGYWVHSRTGEGPAVDVDGDKGITVIASAYLTPAAFASSQVLGVGGWVLDVWFPVDAGATTYAQTTALGQQLRAFAATRQATPAPATFTTELPVTLDRVTTEVAATTTVVALVFSGPLAVVGVLLVIASGVILARRRPALVIARARGGSGLQLRLLMAGQGLVLGVPSAAVGALLGCLLTTGTVSAGLVTLVAAVALAPALVLGLAPLPDHRQVRADAPVSPRRWIWELIVVLLAALSAVLALRSSSSDSPGSPGSADPLVLAAPALLAFAAAVVALRLAPGPLRLAFSVAARRPGAPAFVGAASARRRSAGRLAPTFGLVVATAVTVLATVLLATVQTGIRENAWLAVGADLRASGPYFVADMVAEVKAISGVDEAVAVMAVGDGVISVGGNQVSVRVYVADLDALARVQSAHGRTSSDAAASDAAATDALVSESLSVAADGVGITLYGQQARVDAVQVLHGVPGVTTTTDWVVVDRDAAQERFRLNDLPTALLVSAEDGVDPTTLVGPVGEVTGAKDIRTEADAVTRITDSPAVSGLRAAVLAALGVAVLFGGAALVMSEVVAARGREQTLVVLRILGMPRRGAGVVAAWEIATWSAVGLTAGGVLGLLLPQVVARAVDLSAFTGATTAPELVYPTAALVLVAVGFILFIALCGLLSTVWGRRRAVRSVRTTE